MTKEQWIKFCKALQPGDVLFVESKDITAFAITLGTGNRDDIETAHSFQYVGNGQGVTIEADPKGTNWHHIDEYMDRTIAGKTRLIVCRPKDITVEELEQMKIEWKNLVGRPYGWGAIVGYGIYWFIKNTPIGALISAFKLANPLANPKTPVCSQAVYLALKAHDLSARTIHKKLKFGDCTPEALLNHIYLSCIFLYDTQRIDRYDRWDFPGRKKKK